MTDGRAEMSATYLGQLVEQALVLEYDPQQLGWKMPTRVFPDTPEGKHLMIECATKMLLAAIGEDLTREGLQQTPRRVARMYLNELAIGNNKDLTEVLSASFKEPHDQMVIVKDIPFYSLCEHHMVPYSGRAHIGYVPDGQVVGLSKLARVVELASRKLTIQERLTNEIAEAIDSALKPQGVIVVLDNCEHMCMTMRGIKKAGATTTTSAIRGVFIDTPAAREEFLALITKQ